MPNKEAINVNTDAEVTSIQITINLGKSTVKPEIPEGDAPKGVFLRQVFEVPGGNPTKKIRTSYIPDDLVQDTSTQVAESDPGELAKWKELLGDPQGIDIDTGDIVMRLDNEGGTVTWLPEDTNQEPIIRRFKQKTPDEPGGATIGDFIVCWISKGKTAAAAASCWSRL